MIKLNGLDPDKKYKITYPDDDQEKYPPMKLSGLTLMNAGLPIRREWGDFQSKLIYIEKI